LDSEAEKDADIPERDEEKLFKDDSARPTLKDLLLSDQDRFEIDLPPRGQWKLRPVIRFEDDD
jgi:hypothetical protein